MKIFSIYFILDLTQLLLTGFKRLKPVLKMGVIMLALTTLKLALF